jgi:hypothetical protein
MHLLEKKAIDSNQRSKLNFINNCLRSDFENAREIKSPVIQPLTAPKFHIPNA